MSFIEKRLSSRKPLTRDQLLGIANYLTYARIAMVPVVVLVMMGINDAFPAREALNRFLSWLAMILFVTAQSSDIVDGYYARKYGIVSVFGKFIDPLADKLLSISILIMLVPLGRVSAWVVVILMARETTITALRGIAAAEGIEISASDWGKAKTIIQSIALGFLLVHYPVGPIQVRAIALALLWMTVGISLVSGVHYIMTFFREVVQDKEKDADPVLSIIKNEK